MKTSVCTRGAEGNVLPAAATPGTGLPSSAIRVNPATVAAAPAPLKPCVCDPTIDGTCMRRPAFTKRTRTVPVGGIPAVTGTGGAPVTPAVAWNNDSEGLVLLSATPLIK